jgi:hypothetical protein
LKISSVPVFNEFEFFSRSERYQQVLQEIATAKNAAKQALMDLRKRKRAEKQRHQRVIRKASVLGASELMEIAGLRNMTMQDLSRFPDEMGVPQSAAPPAIEGPTIPSTPDGLPSSGSIRETGVEVSAMDDARSDEDPDAAIDADM